MRDLADFLAKEDSKRIVDARKIAFKEFLEGGKYENQITPFWMEYMLKNYVEYKIAPSCYHATNEMIATNPVHRMHERLFHKYAINLYQALRAREFHIDQQFQNPLKLQAAQAATLRLLEGQNWINRFEQQCVRTAQDHILGLVEKYYVPMTKEFFGSMFASETQSWRQILQKYPLN